MACATDLGSLATVNGYVEDANNDEGGATSMFIEGAPTEDNNESPAPSSEKLAHSSHSPGSSFDTGLTSITAEHYIDWSSLEVNPPPHRSSPPSALSQEMAGLLPFSGTFRHWISGQPAADGYMQDNVATHVHTAAPTQSSVETILGSVQPRFRQAGIRQYTDESCDLPTSDDIMQHLAESCQDRDTQHIGIDGRRMTLTGSTVINHSEELNGARHAYDNIEAEIDQLKEEVLRLREEADRGRTTPKSEQELASDKYLMTRNGSKVLTSNFPIPESAAARLQRQHEMMKLEAGLAAHEQQKVKQPPSPLDFPALSDSKSSPHVFSASLTESQRRKLSYADAATAGMMDAIDQAFSSVMKGQEGKLSGSASDEFPAPSTASLTQMASTATTHDSADVRDDEHSVIISTMSTKTDFSTHNPTFVNQSVQAPLLGKPFKPVPHFAQPTKSFSRRTGETLRKQVSSVSPKSPTDSSPSKSNRTRDTSRRSSHRQPQRKSLPGDWLSGTSQQSESHTNIPASHTGSAPSSPVKSVSPSTKGSWQPYASPHAKDPVAPKPRWPDIQTTPSPRQATSSYMAPTNAATQRAIATIGHEKTSPRSLLRKTAEPKIEPSQEKLQTVSALRSATASSDDSSVQFVLDRPVHATAVSPIRLAANAHPSSPSYRYSPANMRAPAYMTSPDASRMRERHQSTPTKLPQASPRGDRRKEQRPSRNVSSLSSVSGTMELLEQVHKSTTQRRVSNTQLLQPIVASLDAKGLLNRTFEKNSVIESYLQDTLSPTLSSASRPARESSSELTLQSLRTSSNTTQQTTGQVSREKFRAPHLRRSREASHASNSSDTTLRSEAPNATYVASPAHDRLPIQRLLQAATPANSHALPMLPQSSPCDGNPPRVSSLRATANEFKPRSSVASYVANQLKQHDWQSSAAWKSLEACSTVNTTINKAIQNMGSYNNANGAAARTTHPVQRSAVLAPLKATEHPSWNDLMTQVNIHKPIIKSVDQNGSPYGVQPGQTLNPTLSPTKKTVQWMLEGTDGKQSPSRFGRAPPPSVSPEYQHSTPSLSATSDGSSPWQSPDSVRGWQIGSTYAASQFGWSGGDGKEIKFVGHGPHAERDGNYNSINFNFQGRTASFSSGVPNGFKGDRESCPAELGSAPRSQRQWAEKLGYHKVPCGNVEIVQAVEYLPFGASQSASYCHGCMPE